TIPELLESPGPAPPKKVNPVIRRRPPSIASRTPSIYVTQYLEQSATFGVPSVIQVVDVCPGTPHCTEVPAPAPWRVTYFPMMMTEKVQVHEPGGTKTVSPLDALS